MLFELVKDLTKGIVESPLYDTLYIATQCFGWG